MFKWIKNIFSKKEKSKESEKKYKTTSEVSFVDLTGKDIILEVKVNGNETLLNIHDKKNEIDFSFDRELVTLLSVLLQSYILHETFPNLEED